jgi:hypothetical protein
LHGSNEYPLKAEFPKTRELYREVCALLFFRHGITPTANRLYQLVKRGSMGTPTAVLGEFWTELREKSRIRIDHPDLPADLGAAAGELVATLWTRATASAGTALDALRAEVEAQRAESQQLVIAARVETALEQRTAALLAAQVEVRELDKAQAEGHAQRKAGSSRPQKEGKGRTGQVRRKALACPPIGALMRIGPTFCLRIPGRRRPFRDDRTCSGTG